MELVHSGSQNTPNLRNEGGLMGTSENPDLPRSAAEVYDQCFVPALFQQWGNTVCEIAAIRRGQRVLDVACGTGVLAAAAAERVGPDGAVAGLDPNDEMLAVARRKRAHIDWQNGRAEALPFADARFDRVVSQFGFMFFADRAQALREMMRVLGPGGRLAVAVCDALDHSPGYAVLAELLHRLFGQPVAEAFRAPFVLGDRDELLSICHAAGITDPMVKRYDGRVRFDSVAALVSTERACVWTLGGLLDNAQFERLLAAAEESLRPFVRADGKVDFVMPALLIEAVKT
jgi:ubiquinone/menaquinone biosynthesis C-methylase UbiE